jgi:hypothetical protein
MSENNDVVNGGKANDQVEVSIDGKMPVPNETPTDGNTPAANETPTSGQVLEPDKKPANGEKSLRERFQVLFKSIITPITIPVVVGMILLFVEYRSNFFVSANPTPIKTSGFTSKELIAWYAKQNTQIQADDLAKGIYYDKIIQWTGVVRDVLGNEDETATVVLSVDDIDVYAKFKDKTKVSSLTKGDSFSVICRISRIRLISIEIENCQISIGSTASENPTNVLMATSQPSAKPLDVSPRELIIWYKKFDTGLQAEESAEIIYYHKRVQWTGTVRDISIVDNGKIGVHLDIDGIHVLAKFDNRQAVAIMNRGTTIIVLCSLLKINRDETIHVDKCQVIQISK